MSNQAPPPPNSAVALLYDQLSAPKVIAKGKGELADQIIALARENSVPIREEPELVQLLSKVDLGDEIPQSLYVAVAEILTFVYMLKGKLPRQRKDNSDV